MQVLHVAMPPERKSKPRRAVIVGIAVLGAGILAILIAEARAALRRASQNPQRVAQLDELRRLVIARRRVLGS